MKKYNSIQGPNKAPQMPCIGFYKYDGSNFRAEWTPKNGFAKFGSRQVLIDENGFMGDGIQAFLDRYGDDLDTMFRKDSYFRGCKNITVFCEYFGENSFAGWHDPNDPKEVVMFDVNLHKKGLMTPKSFIKKFGHLKIADVVYTGNFNKQFIQDVKDGKVVSGEGVVVKGTLPTGHPPHNIWMAKVKTATWFERLRNKAEECADFRKILNDNIREQK